MLAQVLFASSTSASTSTRTAVDRGHSKRGETRQGPSLQLQEGMARQCHAMQAQSASQAASHARAIAKARAVCPRSQSSRSSFAPRSFLLSCACCGQLLIAASRLYAGGGYSGRGRKNVQRRIQTDGNDGGGYSYREKGGCTGRGIGGDEEQRRCCVPACLLYLTAGAAALPGCPAAALVPVLAPDAVPVASCCLLVKGPAGGAPKGM